MGILILAPRLVGELDLIELGGEAQDAALEVGAVMAFAAFVRVPELSAHVVIVRADLHDLEAALG